MGSYVYNAMVLQTDKPAPPATRDVLAAVLCGVESLDYREIGR